MEQVARVLEKRISSLNAATSRGREESSGECPSQRLLKSASLDSMMGLRSPGSATPERREDWTPPDLAAGIVLRSQADAAFQAASSPFAEAAQQPLEETVLVTPDRVYHSMTRHDHRDKADPSNSQRADPTVKWKENRTLLIFWLVAAIAMLISSLPWLHIGMWAGVVGIIGASLPLSGCCSSKRLPLVVHVTRIFSVACCALSLFTALLFAFLIIKLHCPRSVKSSGYCSVFWLGLVLTMLWQALYALVGAAVSIRASAVVALLDPIALRRVVVLRAPGRSQSLRGHPPSHASHVSQDLRNQ